MSDYEWCDRDYCAREYGVRRLPGDDPHTGWCNSCGYMVDVDCDDSTCQDCAE